MEHDDDQDRLLDLTEEPKSGASPPRRTSRVEERLHSRESGSEASLARAREKRESELRRQVLDLQAADMRRSRQLNTARFRAQERRAAATTEMETRLSAAEERRTALLVEKKERAREQVSRARTVCAMASEDRARRALNSSVKLAGRLDAAKRRRAAHTAGVRERAAAEYERLLRLGVGEAPAGKPADGGTPSTPANSRAGREHVSDRQSAAASAAGESRESRVPPTIAFSPLRAPLRSALSQPLPERFTLAPPSAPLASAPLRVALRSPGQEAVSRAQNPPPTALRSPLRSGLSSDCAVPGGADEPAPREASAPPGSTASASSAADSASAATPAADWGSRSWLAQGTLAALRAASPHAPLASIVRAAVHQLAATNVGGQGPAAAPALRSGRSDSEDADSDQDADDAAQTLQRWWRGLRADARRTGRLRQALEAFATLRGAVSGPSESDFDAMRAALVRPDVVAAAKTVLAAVPKSAAVRRFAGRDRSTRAFLSTLPIIHHADAALGGGPAATALRRAALRQWSAFHRLFEATAAVKHAGASHLRQAHRLARYCDELNAARAAFMTAFAHWRAQDAERLAEEALPAFARLEVARAEVERSGGASAEAGARDDIRRGIVEHIASHQRSVRADMARVLSTERMRAWEAEAAALTDRMRRGVVPATPPSPLSPSRGLPAASRVAESGGDPLPSLDLPAAAVAPAWDPSAPSTPRSEGTAVSGQALRAASACEAALSTEAEAVDVGPTPSDNEHVAHELMVNPGLSMVRGFALRAARARLARRLSLGHIGADDSPVQPMPVSSRPTARAPAVPVMRAGLGSAAGGPASSHGSDADESAEDEVTIAERMLEAGTADSEDEELYGVHGAVAGADSGLVTSIETRVRAAMERAFWDQVASGACEDAAPLVSMFQELRQAVGSLAPRSASLQSQLAATLSDAALRAAFSGPLRPADAAKVLGALSEALVELEAPAHAGRVRRHLMEAEASIAAADAPDAVRLLARAAEAVRERVGAIRAGVADFRLAGLRQRLRGSAGAAIERRTFASRVVAGHITLRRTAQWLHSAVLALPPTPQTAPETGSRHALTREDLRRGGAGTRRLLLLDALLALVVSASPVRADTCPETLVMDVARLRRLQNDAQVVALVASVCFAIREACKAAGTAVTFASLAPAAVRLARLLRRPDARLPHILEHAVRAARGACDAAGSVFEESHSLQLRKLVETFAREEDAVFRLMRKKVVEALRAGVLRGRDSRVAAGGALEALQGKLGRMQSRLEAVWRHSLLVHGEAVYSRLLASLLEAA